MKSRLMWISFPALIALIVSCSGKAESDQEGAASAAAALSTPAVDQGSVQVPIISTRSYVGGSAKVTVTGSFQISEDIAINTKASYSDGQMTWLQYGVSGSEAPDLTVTVSPEEMGIVVGRDKQTATIGGAGCTGNMDVSGNSIAGHYSCPGVTSFDSRAFGLGKVNIEVRFTAKS